MPSEIEQIAEQMYRALLLTPCACRYKGGERWHLRATAEVERLCPMHAAIKRYKDHRQKMQCGHNNPDDCTVDCVTWKIQWMHNEEPA